ncbi:OmpA family protein [Hydrogenophaga sp.]|jgi:peptidoglycan-associated lipoprotein|uniref:OmpA family protein n=1 Tax=Hydrogenophaga sp. TaxID=1904254 RepID=UPI00271A27C3|nr:OmpA family protein [Hydrogenophaga sp.]MDO9146969.1 OmpA family protein [Hydrogenophaga sp.]MDP3326360.1 OmpA family protein [Hydrogenophaga sp.]MDP3885157.1 OmpA family protein [Hydrogenophaga sp.]
MIKHVIPLALIAVLAGCASVQQSTERRTLTYYGGLSIQKPAPAPTEMSSRNVESVVAPGSVQGTPLGIVYFRFDEYVVTPEYIPVLERVARMIKDKPGMNVSLEGHTDAAGSTEYNLALGQRRAEAVRQGLDRLGVSQDQAEAVSFGEEKPALPGRSEEIDARNRRAEIWTKP